MRQLCPKETDLGEYRSSSVHVSLSAKFAEHYRLPQDFVRFSGSSLLVMYLFREGNDEGKSLSREHNTNPHLLLIVRKTRNVVLTQTNLTRVYLFFLFFLFVIYLLFHSIEEVIFMI